ncbi:MAG: purine-nucleoside phosphorylase [Hymenobacteraceae bacterium]|nr:purine-nucleoside phosphorylase [Hymenobacteraceae bacterium]MDX5395821.1 purine-nucleoside phosphorylase [Hymenobacteraceae bacterium]MDX5511876.1 purine-nucleoside phosphorylase [Hymenobacteraceae bacterium]
MSVHIGAKPNEIAKTVLISGDPLRAKHIAEKMLTDVICYNEVRGMLGFTGLYNGKKVSVQGTGMGIPSTAIYLHELINDYGVEKVIRVGTCGGLQPDLALGQLILAEAAFTDSGTNLLFNKSADFVPEASTAMLHQAQEKAKQLGIAAITGKIFSTDIFYSDEVNRWEKWISKGVLAVEMETSIIYTMAAKYNIEALSILSVSDNVITQKQTTAAEREAASLDIMKLALEIA